MAIKLMGSSCWRRWPPAEIPDENNACTYLPLLGALSAATVFPAFAANLTLGTYKLNTAKSSYTPAPNPVQDLTVTRELSSGGITQTTDGTLAGNVPFHASYTTKGDGAAVPVTGNAPFSTIAVKQVDANTTTDQRMNAGSSFRARGRTVFTHHDWTMTMTIKGINGAGREFTQILVFESNKCSTAPARPPAPSIPGG